MSDSLIRVASALVNAAEVAATLAGFGVGGNAAFQLVGAFVGTVTFEATVDGTTFLPIEAIPVGGGAGVTSTTAVGAWNVRTLGYQQVRARCSAYTSGTPSLSGRWTPG